MGRRHDPDSPTPRADVVYVEEAGADGGPATNSFVLLERDSSGQRARYLSWINYFDVEYAALREPGCWSLVEPSTSFEETAQWLPYGWAAMEGVPTIGDAVIAERGTRAGAAR